VKKLLLVLAAFASVGCASPEVREIEVRNNSSCDLVIKGMCAGKYDQATIPSGENWTGNLKCVSGRKVIISIRDDVK
jgi:hypothetical protein